jgi:hypothetical protein
MSGSFPEGIDVSKETIIGGTVTACGNPVPGAYVRLLDSSGEFTAEVVTSYAGGFRFFAGPGEWTLRTLSGKGFADATVSAELGTPTEVVLAL